MTIDEVLEKHFKDQRVRYYRAPDLIHADHYLRYRIVGGRVVLSVGNDEGEVELFVTTSPEKLDQQIRLIIYS